MRYSLTTVAAAILTVAAAPAALADGRTPFYGYSTYFGGPAPYYTGDTDVHSASTQSVGLPGMGTRTYTEGGPFWHHRGDRSVRAYYPRNHRRRVALRRRG